MSEIVLKSLEVNNFRSIRGRIYAPLDAKVVLVHGENGAGKTSLLSAVELALTGKVQSLERADPYYEKQLVHRLTDEGSVQLQVQAGDIEENFKAVLNSSGVRSISSLDKRRANFFRERAFLPQSLLGQLLQIYQEAGSEAESPLAKFVTGLLGLDRLDALEIGLQPLADIRNVRKISDGWQTAENDKSRFDRQLLEQRKSRSTLNGHVLEAVEGLVAICAELELAVDVSEGTLDQVEASLSDGNDAEAFARLMDQQRRLASIRREIDVAQSESNFVAGVTPVDARTASIAFSSWEAEFGPRISELRSRIEALLPNESLPSDPELLAEAALLRLKADHKQTAERTSQARADIKRHTDAQDELDVARRQLFTIDDEISRLSNSTGSLGAVLSEITSFIADDVCPLCDRDFGEVGEIPLSEHVHRKVRMLSASAERLLTVGRSRSEIQVRIDRLKLEVEVIAGRKLDEKSLAGLDRRLASVAGIVSELESLMEVLREGGRLRASDVTARRAISEAQSRRVSLSAALETLSEFAVSIGSIAVEESEPFETAATRLDALLLEGGGRLEERISLRRRGAELIRTMGLAIERRKEADKLIASDFASWQQVDSALTRAQVLRDQGNSMRNAVDEVRSAIIRREFNDRLNRLWRDLFVRLAPGEPFVPAFRIPKSSTRRLQPKLITEHRGGGDAGGTPGAMLSAGNLNTAALTLFTALHLSMPVELPWLILDDPVQSMDDIHIAHFAALLRTLSKEHGRQILIAVHDRQLFEYLKLELSPAFTGDSLLTLELSRGARRDTVCVSKRYSFVEETALLATA